MGFLYSLSNVLIPVSLLIYQSILKYNISQQVPYGKWALMIIAIYLFNLVNWLFQDSYMFLFMDLLVKIVISFIPQNIKELQNTRQDISITLVRCWAMAGLHKYYWKTTQYILTKMEFQECQQFKQGLMRKLKGFEETQSHVVFKPVKHFQNTGVNCLLMTEQIAMTISSTAKKLQEFTQKVANDKGLANQTFGEIKPTKEVRERKPQIKVQKKKQQLPKFSYKKQSTVDTKRKQIGNKKNQVIQKKTTAVKLQSKPSLSLNLKESQHMIDFQQEEQYTNWPQKEQVISPIHNKVKQNLMFKAANKALKVKQQLFQTTTSQLKRAYTFTPTGSEISTHAENIHKAYREDGQQASKELLNKLDLSASDYSDMFQDEQQDTEDIKVLQCKVQVILQIGVGANVRLEIYNLELYSNSDLRIVSLYDRQFEKHKLRAMKKLPNHYYELIFEENAIHSRKCKFRGQHQQFMKYLIGQ